MSSYDSEALEDMRVLGRRGLFRVIAIGRGFSGGAAGCVLPPRQAALFRIDGILLAALTERAERDHVSRSEAIRAAIRSYVA